MLTLVLDPGGLENPGEHPPPVQCQEKRGIFRRWATDGDVAIQASLYQDTIQLLSNLAATSVNILNNKLDTPSLMISARNPSTPFSQSCEGNSLGAIAGRIQNLERKGMDRDLETVISLIQFAVKLDILQEASKKDFTNLIRDEVQSGGELFGCTERQGKRWRAWGTRLVEFAGAGKYGKPE